MVFLSKIYTKSGDSGFTSLGDGTRIAKNSRRVAAYGGCDELSAVLGMALIESTDADIRALIRTIQNDLFDLGADLCVPLPNERENESAGQLRIVPRQIKRLEELIDSYNQQLRPLHSFVLPGGNRLAAWLHIARTVCRKAERSVVDLFLRDEDATSKSTFIYLNRLSDLLFVLARYANQKGEADVLWSPGDGQSQG